MPTEQDNDSHLIFLFADDRALSEWRHSPEHLRSEKWLAYRAARMRAGFRDPGPKEFHSHVGPDSQGTADCLNILSVVPDAQAAWDDLRAAFEAVKHAEAAYRDCRIEDDPYVVLETQQRRNAARDRLDMALTVLLPEKS